MIHIVTPSLAERYQPELQAMHRHRYRVFKLRMGWDVPTANGMERDQFDDQGASYLLRLRDDGGVEASWRLLPTTGPNMLRDVFPALLGGAAVPSAPHILETSRFAVEVPETQTDSLASFNSATSELICGLIEYAMAYGFSEIVTVCDPRVARLLPRLGCPADSRSKTQRIGNFAALVARFMVRQEVLARVRAVAGITGSVVANPEALGGRQAA